MWEHNVVAIAPARIQQRDVAFLWVGELHGDILQQGLVVHDRQGRIAEYVFVSGFGRYLVCHFADDRAQFDADLYGGGTAGEAAVCFIRYDAAWVIKHARHVRNAHQAFIFSAAS